MLEPGASVAATTSVLFGVDKEGEVGVGTAGSVAASACSGDAGSAAYPFFIDTCFA
jgi:hypothetical protein